MKTRTKLMLGSLTAQAALSIRAAAAAGRTFTRMVHGEVDDLLAQAVQGPEIVVSEAMLNDLPEPVQRYLRYTGVTGKPIPRTVHLKQAGSMRLGLNQPGIPLRAEQWYTTRPAGFVWDGTMHLGPLTLARARDKYDAGSGNMLIKLGSIFTVADANGEEMDQSAMMRYLSEIIWFPAAFLLDNISFEALDEESARVTLTDRGRSVSGTLYFDDEGRLTNFVAKRYRMVGGGYQLHTWSAPVTAYGELAGLRLPMRAKAVWNLPEGDLDYIDVAITELEYDQAQYGDLEAASAGEPEPQTEPLIAV